MSSEYLTLDLALGALASVLLAVCVFLLNRIAGVLDKIEERVTDHGERISKLEGFHRRQLNGEATD